MSHFHLTLTLLFAAIALASAESRIWTSSDGKSLQGEITALEGDEITLKTDKGVFKFPLTRLSEADQKFAREWKEKATSSPPAEDDKTVGSFANLELGVWPNSVEAEFELDEIEIVKEDKDAGEYIYRSPHFEFTSPVRLSKSLIREFSRIFEATFAFMKAMPIGLDPKPSTLGYYKTKLYDSREAYFQDGGMQGSGGMHTYSWRGTEVISSLIKVPLTNLGVEFTGTRYIVDHRKRSDTLTHEIAHQVTGRWLPLLPTWVKEGLAETVSTQPYDNGRFRLTQMDRAIRDDVTRRSGSDREFGMINLKRLMTITGSEWASDLASPNSPPNYPSANLLFYYFLRLEGEGNGERFVTYLKALAEGTPEATARDEILLEGRTYEELEEDVAKAWRSEGLRLTFL